ncbi:MAG: type II secretion system F family protein [Halobacteriovoraceae bacterium]|nr:type II secretion system F family protein [Halobacteriovoraceae bacterium]
MANWKWEGIDETGKKLKGSIDAINVKDARKKLRIRGIRPRKISSPSIFEVDINDMMVEKGFSRPFSAGDLTLFTKQLSIMVNAGVPILQSLEILYKQTKQPVLRRSIKSIATDVEEGKTLAEAMSKQRGFDKLYCNLIKAGETGGVLDGILAKLAEHLENHERTKKQIKSAMTYPIIVLIIGCCVVYGMMVFVVPKMMDMVKDSGGEVPAITQFVIDISKFFQNWSWVLLIGAIGGGVFISSIVKTPKGKKIKDQVFMNLPVFGDVVIKANLKAFTNTLSIMLTSGVSIIDSLDITIDIIDNVIVQKDILKVKKQVVEGKTLAQPLSRIKYFPDMVSQMIRIGEQTGNLDEMLIKVAKVFEEEVNSLVSNMTKLIEPFIIVFLGGFVAIILLAMYLPMFDMAGGAGV